MFGFAKTPADMAAAELRDEEMELLSDVSRMELAQSHVLYHSAKIERLKEYVHMRAVLNGEEMPAKLAGRSMFSKATLTGRAAREMLDSEISVLHYASEYDRARCMVDYRETKIARLRAYLGQDDEVAPPEQHAKEKPLPGKGPSATKSMRVIGAV